MKAKYWMTFLVFSVFPAPDSPLIFEGAKENRQINIKKKSPLKRTRERIYIKKTLLKCRF